MRLRRLKEDSAKYTIYVDMDGVLCDFLKGAGDAVGTPFKTYKDWEKVKKVDWLVLADMGSAFWANLDWMPDGKKLWSFVKKYEPNILSAFPQAPQNRTHAVNGKHEWIRRELTGYKKIHLVKGQDKQNYATPTSILIDDSERNIKQFTDKGGIGILHKSADDTIRQLKKILAVPIKEAYEYYTPKKTMTVKEIAEKYYNDGDKAQEPFKTSAGERYTIMASVSELDKYKEYTWSNSHFRKKDIEPEYWNKLIADIKKNGIRNPLTIILYKNEHRAKIGEGNHRLGVAKELGIKELPVRFEYWMGKEKKPEKEDKEFNAMLTAIKKEQEKEQINKLLKQLGLEL